MSQLQENVESTAKRTSSICFEDSSSAYTCMCFVDLAHVWPTIASIEKRQYVYMKSAENFDFECDWFCTLYTTKKASTHSSVGMEWHNLL